MRNLPFGFRTAQQRKPDPKPREDFQDLEAMELYCATCRSAVPVRKSLLLVLPDGDRYEYRCTYCGSKVGDKIDRSGQFYGILQR